MIGNLLNSINIVREIIVITFLFAIFKLSLNSVTNKCLFGIISISFLCEIINIIISSQGFKTNISSTFWVVFHSFFWIYLLFHIIKKKAVFVALIMFLIFSIYNIVWLQKLERFNYYTFLFGALIYLSFYFLELFDMLKNENFAFISSNNFLLISSPVFFLFGMSLMFAFVSRDVTQTILFKKIVLYDFVNYFVNFIYYLLVTIYIYKESRVKNVKL
jgi:hypothetical protein